MKVFQKFIMTFAIAVTAFLFVPAVAPAEEAYISDSMVALGADLTYYVYAVVPESVSSPKLEITINDKTRVLSGEKKDGKYVFVYEGIKSDMMTQHIGLVLTDGTNELAVSGDRIIDYCTLTSGQTPEALGLTQQQFDNLKTLLADMLNYGGKAQKFLGNEYPQYADDIDIVDKNKSEYVSPESDYKVLVPSGSSGDAIKSATLRIGKDIRLVVRFNADQADRLVIEDDEKEQIFTVSSMQADEGEYLAVTDGIKACELEKVYTIKLMQGDTVVHSIRYSVNSYIKAKENDENTKLAALVKTIRSYGASAWKYAIGMMDPEASIGTRLYDTIEEAVAAAKPEETVKLLKDVTISKQLLIDKNITLTTDGCGDKTIFIDKSFVPGEDNTSKWAVYLASAKSTLCGTGEDSRLIIDGQNTEHERGGLYVSTTKGANVSYVTVQNCVNTASGNNGAGGVYVSNGTDTMGDTVLDHMIIRNNTSLNGNAGGIILNSRNLCLKNSVIEGNKANSGSGGGLLSGTNSGATLFTINVENCLFKNNSAVTGINAKAGTYTNMTGCFFDGEKSTVTGTELVSKCTFRTDYDCTGKTSLIKKLPAYDGGLLVGIFDGMGDTQEAVYTCDSRDTYDAFIAKAAQAGFAFTEKTIDNLVINTAAKSGIKYFVYYTPNTESLRIVAETAQKGMTNTHKAGSVIPSLSFINVSDESTDTTLKNTRYGLSMLYQLSDGSFIVVDGGYNYDSSAVRLYNRMVALNNGNTSGIRIAAWIFTHSHNDHVAVYKYFMDKYKKNVTVENLIYNFPADYEYSLPRGEEGANTNYRNQVETYKTLSQNVIKAHAGDIFEFGSAKIEVLSTLELVKPVIVANVNETSVIYKITVGGYTTTVLGDTSQYTEPVLIDLFPQAIKADITTVAHHGYSGRTVTSAIYKTISPTYVLWPASETVYSANKTTAANKWLISNIPSGRLILAYMYDANKYLKDSDWTYSLNFNAESFEPIAKVNGKGYGSLSEAVNAASAGQTITLLDDITLSGTAAVNKAVTIDCAGKTIKAAADNGYSLILGGGAVLKNAVINGEKLARTFALVQVDGSATINNVTFKDCYATAKSGDGSRGAALYLTADAKLTLNNCIFDGNKADDSDDSDNGVGAALYAKEGAYLTATGCEFKNNRAKYRGGAIYSSMNAQEFINCKFTGNTSGNAGGAVVLSGASRTMTVEGCTFSGNETVTFGGALATSNAASGFVFRGTNTFDKNVVTTGGTYGGGAIMAGTVTVASGTTVFTNNKAPLGGAINIQAKTGQALTVSAGATLEIGTTNKATANGQSIYFNNDSKNVTATFSGNYLLTDIFSKNATVTLTIAATAADKSGAASGPGFTYNGANLTVTDNRKK